MIDAHNHADWLGHDLSRTLANMDKFGINRAWVLTWESPLREYSPASFSRINVDHERDGGPVSFARCLSYKQQAKDRFVLGFCPDPRVPGALDRLRSAIDLYGVQVCGEWKFRMTFDNPDAIRLFRFAGDNGLPVVLHLEYPLPTQGSYPYPDYWYGGSMEALDRAAALCPDTILIGHAPGFWAHISGDDAYQTQAYPKGSVAPGGLVQKMLEKHKNLYCDLSGYSGLNALQRDKRYAEEFLMTYHSRILFGRDQFHNQLKEFLDTLSLPEDVLDCCSGANYA